MNTRVIATLTDGSKIAGWLTTENAASSYGQPVFADDRGQAYNWADITDISFGALGGSARGGAKADAARENGRKGGRPKKQKPE